MNVASTGGVHTRRIRSVGALIAVCALAWTAAASAGVPVGGRLKHVPLPPVPPHRGDSKIPARELFAAKSTPASMPPRSIGFYAHGCLAGAVQLPITGPTWQVMRLSRNRNWGHPDLVRFLERLANKAHEDDGWPGLLVGDMSQPRGGPMLNGHASHQIGLDVDIWLTPMPKHVLTRLEREDMSAAIVVASDRRTVNSKIWTPAYAGLIKIAAEDPVVERIFVNAAIKKDLCETAGSDRTWLHKVRPYWGHDDHFHVRIRCPAGSPSCEHQPPIPAGDGCGKALDWWFRPGILHVVPPKVPTKPKRALTMANLPAACRQVLHAP